MAINTLSVDPRLINPLVCNPQDGPGRFAVDTLHRCASLLELFGRLIGSHDGAGDLFQEDDHAFAFHLQLEGVASTLRAVADSLSQPRNPDKGASLIESLKGVGIACDAAKAAVDTDGGGTETIFESLKIIRAIAGQELNELEGAQ